MTINVSTRQRPWSMQHSVKENATSDYIFKIEKNILGMRFPTSFPPNTIFIDFTGDLTDISAKTATLNATYSVATTALHARAKQ